MYPTFRTATKIEGSIKFFHLKTTGLALGESWPLLAQRNTDVNRQTYINHLRDINYRKLMGTNAMALIQAITKLGSLGG